MVVQQVARRGKSVFASWFAIEAIPIYVIMAGALGGASFYLYRLSTRPDVIWSRKNPEPWQTVKPNENIKFMAGQHKYDGKWTRDKF